MSRDLPTWGLHPRTPAAAYRLWPAANYSSIKQFYYTPLHVYQELTDPSEETDAMRFGTATHTAILEPERFEHLYVRGAAGNLRSKGPKDENEQIKFDNPDKQIVRDKEWPKLMRMRDRVWEHPRAREVLSSEGFTELSYLWVDPVTSLACKARIDKLGGSDDGWPIALDLKSFGEKGGRLTDSAIERVIHDRQYHIQAAHYLNGLDVLSPSQRRFILLLVEKSAPFAVRMVEIDFAALELGRRQIDRWLKRLKKCQETGEWPGWSTGFDPIGVPAYAYSQEEEDE
ncbi:MAG: PD-(D/E)XK nuclease-like domain-containing protein [Deltaproteobacteria bacterium]|nr:PD-(D/E)XK nuclease-like domain-containing protein [Deltaproteobacteria bacterium]